jgi:hypothetical protein
LQSLLKASLDEALDDLWQLRTDATSWLVRMQEVRNSGSGRTSNLLRAMFGRIDVFHVLCERMDALQNKGWCGTQYNESMISPPSGHIDSFKDVISMYVAFRCVLNEALSSMRVISWSPHETTNATFSRLVNMINKDDPTLRVMGLDAVLRVIEREIQEVETQEVIPSAVMQALNDMSVVAVCMRETQKHHTFVPSVNLEYITLANQAEAKWMERERPWTSVIQHALRRLDSKMQKLDDVILDKGPLSERHRAFWKTIDKSWEYDMKTNPVVDMILSNTPPPPLVENTSMRDWTIPEATMAASDTKAKLSRRHGSKIQTPSARSTAPSPVEEPQPPRPTITIKRERDKEFWKEMWKDNGRALGFLELCEFLRGGGYTMSYQGGSGRRFELRAADGSSLDAIVFHNNHGRQEQKVAHHLARQWWGKRIKNHVSVVVLR